jgi:hypothetical protein
MHVTLFWEAKAGGSEAPTARLALTGAGGETLAVAEGLVAPADYPPAEWLAGEIIRDQRYLFLPGEVKTGAGALTISLGGWSTRLASLQLEGR